jgi:hypothetical protein
MTDVTGDGRKVPIHASGQVPESVWRCVSCGAIADPDDTLHCGHPFGLFRPSDPDNWKLPKGCLTAAALKARIAMEKE